MRTNNGLAAIAYGPCRVTASLRLEACHAVLDQVEARLMAKLPQLKRVIAHAETLGHAKHKL